MILFPCLVNQHRYPSIILFNVSYPERISIPKRALCYSSRFCIVVLFPCLIGQHRYPSNVVVLDTYHCRRLTSHEGAHFTTTSNVVSLPRWSTPSLINSSVKRSNRNQIRQSDQTNNLRSRGLHRSDQSDQSDQSGQSGQVRSDEGSFETSLQISRQDSGIVLDLSAGQVSQISQIRRMIFDREVSASRQAA